MNLPPEITQKEASPLPALLAAKSREPLPRALHDGLSSPELPRLSAVLPLGIRAPSDLDQFLCWRTPIAPTRDRLRRSDYLINNQIDSIISSGITINPMVAHPYA